MSIVSTVKCECFVKILFFMHVYVNWELEGWKRTLGYGFFSSKNLLGLGYRKQATLS